MFKKIMVVHGLEQARETKMAYVVLKLKIISEPTVRNRADGSTIQHCIAISAASKICDLYIAQSKMKHIELGKYITVTRCRLNDTVKVTHVNFTEETKVAGSSAFAYNEDVVNDFSKAKIVTIAEAIGSPLKRRLSITASVITAQPEKCGKGWKRRDITVADDNGQVMIKLWGDKATKKLCVGQRATFRNLRKEEYNSQKYLASTNETELEIDTTETERQVIMEGIDEEGQTCTLICKDASVYKAESTLLEAAFGHLNQLTFPIIIIII